MMVSCQLVSRPVIEIQEVGFKTFGTEIWSSGEWLAFIDSSWQCYYMLGTTIIVNTVSSSGVVPLTHLWLHLKYSS